jgi:hypothetical protein
MIPISVVGHGVDNIRPPHGRSEATPEPAIPPVSTGIPPVPLCGSARIASSANAVLEVLAEALRLACAARARDPSAD